MSTRPGRRSQVDHPESESGVVPVGRRRRGPGPTVLLALYPAAWRRRYGDELDALIVDMHAGGRANGWRVGADLVRAAARERLRGCAGDPGQRVLGGASLVLWGWALFVLAGAIVAKTSEHWQRALPAHAGANAAFAGLTSIAFVTGALVVAGIALALPAAARRIRDGGWRRLRSRVLLAGALTALVIMATAALTSWAHGLSTPDRNGHDSLYAAAFLCWAALIATCVLAWTAVATRLARELSCRRSIVRAHALIAPLIAIGMAAMTAATIVWWAITGHASAAALTGGSSAPHPSALVPALAFAVALMLVATVIATVGAARADFALKDLSRSG